MKSNVSTLLKATALALAIIAVGSWYTFYGPGYYSEFNEIESKFSQIPDVQVIESNYNRDFTLEDIEFTVLVKNKGIIKFNQLSRQSFTEPTSLSISEIGPYNIMIRGYGHRGVIKSDTQEPMKSRFGFGSIDLKKKDGFESIVPFEIQNVYQAIENYDEICAYLSTWPQDPDYESYVDTDLTEYEYRVKISNETSLTSPDTTGPKT